MTTKGNMLKVIELGLQDKVYNALKQPGFSAQKLAEEFTIEGTPITAQSIRKFVKKTQAAQQAIISKDMRVANDVIKLTMDYEHALKDILEEVKEVKNMAKDEKDFTTYNQLIGRLLQGIELIAKLTGDIKPKGSIDVKIIYNEINGNIEREMKDIKRVFNREDNIIDVDDYIEKEDKKEAEKLEGEEK